jgi:prepilin-type N-terminal cleavage/methylation domain-containing protein
MNVQRKQKGFTIIEVVLVLAIAGLIFLMVFIALPALQRSQRDTQRKDDLSRFTTALQNYATNNRGSLPVTTTAFGPSGNFISTYLAVGGSSFTDPSGTPYSTVVVTPGQLPGTDAYSSNVTATQGVFYISPAAVCGATGDTTTTAGATGRNEAVQIALENGGFSCQNI